MIAASPNTQFDDIQVALRQLVTPWNWFSEKPVREFERAIGDYHKLPEGVALDSARSAFYLALKHYGVGPGDEVLLPAFTCLVIANPVIWLGATPIYVDIRESDFNLDIDDLKRKLTPRAKALLVQHTFGMPVDVSAVRRTVGSEVKIIEDLAHALGGLHQGQQLGTLGDAAVLTFGIEKVISSVRGGMLISHDQKLLEAVRSQVNHAPEFTRKRILVSLLNPIFWSLAKPLYYVGVGKFTLGKAFVWLAHKLNLLGNMIEECEYDTMKPAWLPARFPGALAQLGLRQLQKLEKFNTHRMKIASIYQQELNIAYPVPANSKHIYLRFPVLVGDGTLTRNKLRNKRIILGDWYKSILYAPERSWKLLRYAGGNAPVAERVARRIINLPTHINVNEAEAKRIAQAIKN